MAVAEIVCTCSVLLVFDRWYIILFSRLDYEVIGTNGIIIQEMNVIIIIMDDAINTCTFVCNGLFLCCWIDVHRYCRYFNIVIVGKITFTIIIQTGYQYNSSVSFACMQDQETCSSFPVVLTSFLRTPSWGILLSENW